MEAGALGGCGGGATPVVELCNGVDDDCDGTTDEGVLPADDPQLSQACGKGICAGLTICDEATGQVVALGTSSFNVQRGDRFLVGTELYEVIYVAPAQASAGERVEAHCRQVQ